jgi:hypothetical protein
MPTYVMGDVFSARVDLLLFPANGVVTARGLVMGAGAAKEFAARFGHLQAALGGLLGEGLHRYGLLLDESGKLGAFQTKLNWRDSSSLELIAFSTQQLLGWLEQHPESSVAMPFPGIGLGGLKPNAVARELRVLPQRVFIHQRGKL